MSFSQSSLETWISEHLHQFLGFSDQATAQFIEALAKNASHTRKLYSELVEYGFPEGKNLEIFTSSLFHRTNPGEKER
eukprot:jgi/Galph1/5841/GphlegSOOS_G4534.1